MFDIDESMIAVDKKSLNETPVISIPVKETVVSEVVPESTLGEPLVETPVMKTPAKKSKRVKKEIPVSTTAPVVQEPSPVGGIVAAVLEPKTSTNPYDVGTKKHNIFSYIEAAGAMGVTRRQIEGNFGSYGWSITYTLKSTGFLELIRVQSADARVATKIPVYRVKA